MQQVMIADEPDAPLIVTKHATGVEYEQDNEKGWEVKRPVNQGHEDADTLKG